MENAIFNPDTVERRAACTYGNGTITLQGIPQGIYVLTVYLLDYDSLERQETLTVQDMYGVMGPTESISDFSCGRYIRFLVNGGGDITVSLNRTAGPNAVISGLFLDYPSFDPGPFPCLTQRLLPDNDDTQGNWNEAYGSLWYALFSIDVTNKKQNYPVKTGDKTPLSPSIPVNYSMTGFGGNWAFTDYIKECITESGSIKDVSFAWSWYFYNWGWDNGAVGALKIPVWSSMDVIYPVPQPSQLTTGTWASCNDSDAQVPLYVDLYLPPAGQCDSFGCYEVAFYASDFDANNRNQTVEIFNENGELLASVDGGPVGKGIYYIFKMKAGSYVVKINAYSGTNSILSGIFIDCIPCPSENCPPEVYPLIAGAGNPNTPSGTVVGTVTVSNDENNLYVTYTTNDSWYLTQTQLYVTNYPLPERKQPGQAPYKSGKPPYLPIPTPPPYTQTYTFEIPLANLGFDLTCNETYIWLQAHADVIHLNQYGQIDESETAYGGVIENPGQGAWYGNIQYKYCCEENGEEHCYDFKGQTAWAAGTRYVTKGNWATYTTYSGLEKTVTLLAGQTMNAGTVHFSAPSDGDGNVTITISLNEGWMFANIPENVKIQGYAVKPPAVNPAPGLFAWKAMATGSPFSIIVPQNKFYGVHVEVGEMIEIPCPE